MSCFFCIFTTGNGNCSIMVQKCRYRSFLDLSIRSQANPCIKMVLKNCNSILCYNSWLYLGINLWIDVILLLGIISYICLNKKVSKQKCWLNQTNFWNKFLRTEQMTFATFKLINTGICWKHWQWRLLATSAKSLICTFEAIPK